jgi:hypothetical protein
VTPRTKTHRKFLLEPEGEEVVQYVKAASVFEKDCAIKNSK